MDVIKRFCAQCTIPWPCNHCSYTVDRNSLLSTLAELQARIVRIRQINVPDPPLSMVRHLMEKYPAWREIIADINTDCNTDLKQAALRKVTEWMETKCSTERGEYQVDVFWNRIL